MSIVVGIMGVISLVLLGYLGYDLIRGDKQ
jgi:hypothetical protein